MSETKWTRKICTGLERDCNCMVVPLVGNVRQMNGLPDRLILHRKLEGTVWAEFKGPRTQLRLVQKLLLKRVLVHDLAVVIRQPGRVESPDGELLCTFEDDDHCDLFECLRMLAFQHRRHLDG